MRTAIVRLVQHTVVLIGIWTSTRRRFGSLGRAAALLTVVAVWMINYARYRRSGRAATRSEFELLRAVNWEAVSRHYNERVPTIEQELDLWGPYHAHRHLMRYDIVEDAVRRHVKPGDWVLDLGCGGALVADRTADLDVNYVGSEFADPLVRYAHVKYSTFDGPLKTRFVRNDAIALPFSSGTFDVVVMSEVIEHLIRPELAVWEIARVLRPGGVLVMSTNNASEMPLLSPLIHPFAWIEKCVAASFPQMISLRPWVWPDRVDRDLLPDDSPDVYLPHTHHISAETRAMFAGAGLRTLRWFTFEFPPPQSGMAARLGRLDAAGRRVVDALERVARAVPGIRHLGTHLYVEAQKVGAPVNERPPAGIWPGPLSVDRVADASERLDARA